MNDIDHQESNTDHTGPYAHQNSALFQALQMLHPDQIKIKLNNNTSRIFLSELRNKDVYLQKNICVDGREDGEGIASFGGAAGTLGANYLALKRFFGATKSEQEIINTLYKFVGDTKLYLHDDTHAKHQNGDTHPCTCGNIGCGAVQRMLGAKDLDVEGVNKRGFPATDRELFWKFLQDTAQIKVLTGDHKEESILRVKNATRTDHTTKEPYIDIIQKNKKTFADGSENQDFGYHETGRNIIIDYLCEDMAEFLCTHEDHEVLRALISASGNHNADAGSEETLKTALKYILKQYTMEIADQHTSLTAADLPPAKKLLDAGHVVYIDKLSHKNNHRFTVHAQA